MIARNFWRVFRQTETAGFLVKCGAAAFFRFESTQKRRCPGFPKQRCSIHTIWSTEAYKTVSQVVELW